MPALCCFTQPAYYAKRICRLLCVSLIGSQSLILETCLVGALFFVLIYLLNALRTGWKQYAAFRTVPMDPDQHFLFGHTPRERRVSGSAALVVSL